MESPSYFLPDVAIGNSSLLLPRRGSVFSVYMYCFQANLSSFFFYFFFLSSPLPDFAAKLPVEGVGNARSSWETGRSARSYIKLIFVGERSLIIRLIGNIEWEREREREREGDRETGTRPKGDNKCSCLTKVSGLLLEDWKKNGSRVEVRATRKNDAVFIGTAVTIVACFVFNYKVINVQPHGNTINDSRWRALYGFS